MGIAADLEPSGALSAPVPSAVFIQQLLQVGFSPSAYAMHYGDLAPLGTSRAALLNHFLRQGIHERRSVPLTLDLAAFEALARMEIADADLRAGLLANRARYVSAGMQHPYGPAITERWPAINRLRLLGGRPLMIVGDSHSCQFAIAGVGGADWLLPPHILCEAGSATGLGNPNSRSGYGYGQLLQTLVRELTALPDFDRLPILLQFGQVDIEFVYHFRRVRARERIYDPLQHRNFCDDVLDRYFHFLIDLFPPPRRARVFLVSPFPPALSDAAWKSGWFNDQIASRETDLPLDVIAQGIRGMEIADIRERTAVHLYFSSRMRVRCGYRRFSFIDAAMPFLGPDGVLHPRYIAPEPGGFDHHIDGRHAHEKIVPLIFGAIAQAARD